MHLHLNVKCYYQRAILHKPTFVNYNQATERRPIDVEDGMSAGFPCFICRTIPLHPFLTFANHPKALVAGQVYRVVIATILLVNRIV